VQAAARPSGQERSKATVVLATPFGVHTDDLDAMVKRGNIRALVPEFVLDFIHYASNIPIQVAMHRLI
jgi:hypothetical protein